MKFQEKVWKLLEQIPEGKVAKYGIIAKKLNSKAFRAVGNACHNNPNAPKIPCHRVVNSNGNVGGFAAGIDN
ncbi:MAG: MGMT family protein, partial [Candidatus Aenigmarchaeota archaeon]|nr:MGMT family protein [Candidatus Aenigmarchaeota archaeon]